MSDAFVPKFLASPEPADTGSAEDPSALPATEEQLFSYITRVPEVGRPLTFYQKELARLLSLGKKPGEIAELMKCSTQFVYACQKNPEIVAEAERYRDRIFEGDVAERLKELNASAFAVAEDLIRSSGTKPNLRWDAAKWILEKTTGRAVQAVDIQSSTLEAFHKLLTDMSQRGETLDITPRVSEAESSQAKESDGDEFDAASWVLTET